MNPSPFGQKLKELRKKAGLTQPGLARRLYTTAELISLWERAYQHKGRRWVPDRPAVVRLVEILADHLTPEEAQQWVALLDYRLSQSELRRLFPAYPSASPTPATGVKHLAMPPDQPLFGVSQQQERLRTLLEQPGAPWLIALDGIGGIGKSSLAAAVVRQLSATPRFGELAWLSAKQEEFLPHLGRHPTPRPALTPEMLTHALLAQLEPGLTLDRSAEEKQFLLTQLLKQQSYLIVIDNLETVADYETLLPFLRQLAQPSKFLLTSRHSLYACADVFGLSLTELSPSDTLALLQYEAETRGIAPLAQASPAHLHDLYQVVGGNPLALKLVAGQLGVLPLAQVLENLRQARGHTIDDLYTYIYWQAWQLLDPAGRHTLLMMPLAQEGPLDQLLALTQLDSADLSRALFQLVGLSLVQASGDLADRRYTIHRLTETFLLREVAKWQDSP